MPDVFEYGPNVMLVPFFGRLARAMPGIAYFARKTGAQIVPAYAYTNDRLHTTALVESPLQVSTSESSDALYGTTAAIFRNMQEHFTRAPHLWMLIQNLRSQVTALESPLNLHQFRELVAPLSRRTDTPTNVVRAIESLIPEIA